uniref:Uncharacterized protein n=1 Tax=Rhizophora mucronata TaxID=61149 RepID=A0A2P2Q1N4_RHIMU
MHVNYAGPIILASLD